METQEIGRPLVTCQTGDNESFLVGTREQLLALAGLIVKAVNSATTDEFFGHSVRTSQLLSGQFDLKAGFGIDVVVVVGTDAQKDEVFYSVYNS